MNTTTENKHDIISIARRIAEKAHAKQLRFSGDPYIVHPKRMAEDLQKSGAPDELSAAAWLHDVLEDSPTTAADLLAEGIPQRTVDLVVALTHVAGEEYVEYILRLAGSFDPSIIGLKLTDLADNLSDLKPGHQRDKYLLAGCILRTAMEDMCAMEEIGPALVDALTKVNQPHDHNN